MAKLNCWELKDCGKITGEAVCPAYTESRLDGANSGVNGGRACWVVAGTLCRDCVQGSFADKIHKCLQCDFYRHVQREESAAFVSCSELLSKVRD